MANDVRNVRMALARALAAHQVEPEVIDRAATKLAALPKQIRGIDICQYGICLDLFFDDREWRTSLKEMLDVEGHEWEKFDVLIHGLPHPDLVHVRLGERLEGIPRSRGFER